MNETLLTVFHLDDDEFDLELIRGKLEQSKSETRYKVRSFTNVESFLQTYKKEKTKPDIVLLDYSMESNNCNGISVGQEIKKIQKDQITILLSYIAEEQLAKDSRSAGLDNYITKKSVNFPNFPQILGDTYSISKHGQLNQLHSVSLKSALVNSVGDTMKFHIKRLPSVISSNSKFILVTGERGAGKSFYLAALSDYLDEQDKRTFKLNGGTLSKTEIKEVISTSKEKKYDYLFLFNLDLISHLLISTLTRLLNISSTSSTCIVISATSKESIPTQFNEYLSGIEVIFPPLRERSSEIIQHAGYFLRSISNSPTYLDSAVELVLSKYSYNHGNISELRSILKQMSILRTGNTLTVASLPDSLLFSGASSEQTFCTSQCLGVHFNPSDLLMDYYNDRLLVALIHKILHADSHSREKSTLSTIALRLGISRQTLAKRVNALISKKLLNKTEVNTWYGS